MASRGERGLQGERCAAALPLVVVTLPAALLPLFPRCAQRAELRAATVGTAIDALNTSWPGMRDRICDSSPRIRRHINIFVAGERATLQTRLTEGTEVLIMTAISGG
jgi:molybdopterin synthase sulfur carrier subunit